jgi:hypothetical protein
MPDFERRRSMQTAALLERLKMTWWVTIGAVGVAVGCGDSEASGGSGSEGGADGAGGGIAGAAGDGGMSGEGGESGAGGEGGGVPVPTEHFSFFVTSLEAMRALSGDELGFGGDFRFGETGPGAGLRGADKICAAIADTSMPGASGKGWRAFLSAADDGSGAQVNAIDRVGDGPWYDRLGRVVALTKDDLLSERPSNADGAIVDDLPNEDGVPNHQPDPTMDEVDNHHILTGSDEQGELLSAGATCEDWTSTGTDVGHPRVGLSWPREGGGGPGARNWISALDESGCAPGVNLVQSGGPGDDGTVGSGGGYGGLYCFALLP